MNLEEHSIHYFIEKYNIKTSNGVSFDFKQRSFMWDIMSDFSPLQVLLKPPQIGATETNIVKVFWYVKYKSKDAIYTLPTYSDIHDMAGGKVDRIVANNPIFQQWVSDKDAVEQKAIGKNRIYFRGTWTTKAAMMVSSQLNIHDEVDASDQGVIEQYETRLQAQAGGSRWYFSHPSVVDFGVDKYWQMSDQKHWFIQCPHCGKEHYLEWPNSIDKERKCFICKLCKEDLTDKDRSKGRWIAKYSKEWQEENGVKPFSGYWISQLMCPWITAEKILKDFGEKSSEYFYNYVLGLPYSGGDSKLTQKHLFQNLTNTPGAPNNNERVIIGIDTGLKIDYVMGNERLGLFYHGDTDNYNELDNLMRRFPRAIAVMDAGGDLIGSREFFDRWKGRVFLMYLTADSKGAGFVNWKEGEDYGHGTIERDKTIQLVVDEFRTAKIPLQGTESDWYEYWIDWSNLSRIKIFDTKTNQIKGTKWVRNGRDHRALATVFWRVGVDRFSDMQAEIIMPKNDFASSGYEA